MASRFVEFTGRFIAAMESTYTTEPNAATGEINSGRWGRVWFLDDEAGKALDGAPIDKRTNRPKTEPEGPTELLVRESVNFDVMEELRVLPFGTVCRFECLPIAAAEDSKNYGPRGIQKYAVRRVIYQDSKPLPKVAAA